MTDRSGDAKQFAQQWCDAWNSHDVDAVLKHFHEDVRFHSPVATTLIPGSGGMITGKAGLNAYWSEGIKLIPDLRFTVDHVYAGINSVIIQYRNQKDTRVIEMLLFDGALVREGHAAYPANEPNPAGLQHLG